jgi:hypothetical protein
MKKLLIAVAVIIGASFILLSCRKQNKYSCDPNIEKYVTENVTSYEGITRADLCKYGLDTAIAIFRTLSSDNKASIWKEKMQYIIDSGNLSGSEIQFFQNLKNKITADVYSGNEPSEEISQLIMNAKTQFGWSDTLAAVYFEIPYTYMEFMSYFVPASPIAGSGSSCTCRKGFSSCFIKDYDYCGGDCALQDGGCGFLWLSDCDGRCHKYGDGG